MNAIEEVAGEQLGVERRDRPAIFRETATAATDADLPYWLVLLLSGGIATLGLAQNSSAVVIGAMLVAPLLSPVVGLAMALAVGDLRLTLQTALMVLLSTVAVVVFSALLTLALPFQTVTAEIVARTNPTTLDLVIAIFSGLAGAVVTVARGHRLSAAIPGVAIAVALIPPLSVAGFGLGAGRNWEVISGSLLLYGANLAGIVLSGMAVFMLVGMHGEAVLDTAREWHESGRPAGLFHRLDRVPAVRRLGIIRSGWARMGLVLGFVVAVAVPLARTLEKIALEVRVRGAVDTAAAIFEIPGRSSVIDRRVVRSGDNLQVYIRVATREWFGRATREAFEREVSRDTGARVELVLQQIPAATGEVEQLAELIAGGDPPLSTATPQPALAGLLSELDGRMRESLEALALPDGTAIAGSELALGAAGARVLRVGYASPAPLPPEAQQILARQLDVMLGDEPTTVEWVHVSTAAYLLGGADTAALATVAGALRRFPALRATLVGGDSAATAAARARLLRAGVAADRVSVLPDTAGDGPTVRLEAVSPQ